MSTQTQTQTTMAELDPIAAAAVAEWNPVGILRQPEAQFYADLFTARYPQIALVCGTRLAGAVKIMTTCGARKPGDFPGMFLVQSQSNPRGWYQVDIKNHTCSCPDHPRVSALGGMCKHRLAIGLQLFGHEWAIESQRKTITESVARQRELEAHRAHVAAEEAWDAQMRLVDEWEYIAWRYGADDPRTITAKEKVLEATRKAESLQALANKI